MVRALDGARLATVRFGLIPIAVEARDGGSDSEILLLGTEGEETLLQVLGLDGTLRAEAALPSGGRAEALALVSGGRPVVLWRNTATGRAELLVFDAALGPVASHPLPRDAGAVLAGVEDDAVVAYRAERNGTVRVARPGRSDRRDPLQALLPSGFDPAAAASGADGTVAIAAHRLGDGSVLISRFGPDGALLAQLQYRPG